MAANKIGYAAKSCGDLWTATDANEVKQVANNHADLIDGHTSSINTINGTLDNHNTALQQQGQILNRLNAAFTPSVWLTQVEYDALVAAGEVDADVEYNIYEE